MTFRLSVVPKTSLQKKRAAKGFCGYPVERLLHGQTTRERTRGLGLASSRRKMADAGPC